MTSDVDVIVVGAGAAGLAAGRHLMAAGVSMRVIEARDRSGGRAWTDTETFDGLGFDHGCHWLHSASINPLRAEADRLSVPYLKQESWREWRLFDQDHWIDKESLAKYGTAVDKLFVKLDELSDQGRDVPASQAFDPSTPYVDAVRHLFAQVTSAELEDVSAADGPDYEDTDEDYPVEQGYGALIQKIAAGVPVTVSTPVERIDWSGDTVVVQTSDAALRAKTVIVTVSTNALIDGRIDFAPELPADIIESLEAVPLGSVEKVAFLFDAPIEAVPVNSFATIVLPDNFPLYFQLNPSGRPMAVAHLAGDKARRLAAEGDDAMINFAQERLLGAFGSELAERIKATTVTGWTTDPFIQGAYSNARPGKAHVRQRLAEPFSERLFLAGEATSMTAYATAHGAHESGIRAADWAMAAIAKAQ